MLNRYFFKRHFSSKIILKDLSSIFRQIPDKATIMIGGFGLCGVPDNLINALKNSGQQQLTIISNNCGTNDQGLGILIKSNQIKRIITSYAGENTEINRKYFLGEVAIEITPQGTLAEKIRSGGAGIPAFYTQTGVDTVVELGGFPIKYKRGGVAVEEMSVSKPVEIFNGKRYLRESTIFADFALIKAYQADTKGNIRFHMTARNFNEDMCMAANKCIVEVEEIVPAGTLLPDDIHVQGVFVDYIYKPDTQYSKKIERLVYDQDYPELYPCRIIIYFYIQQEDYVPPKQIELRNKIAMRAAKELKNGMYVNLGIGIPTLIPSFIDPSIQVDIHSEIGVFGIGKYPIPGEEDPDIINAGKESVTLKIGASIFSASQSFAIIRGGHLDVTILGALQVSREGDIANWIVPGQFLKGIGGAMDLVHSGSKVIVTMKHCSKQEFKLVEKCKLPITGLQRVDMVITEKAVFEKRDGELILTEIASDSSFDEVRSITGWDIKTAEIINKF